MTATVYGIKMEKAAAVRTVNVRDKWSAMGACFYFMICVIVTYVRISAASVSACVLSAAGSPGRGTLRMVRADETDVVLLGDRLWLGDVHNRSVDGWIAAMLFHIAAVTVWTTCSPVSATDRLSSIHSQLQSADLKPACFSFPTFTFFCSVHTKLV